MEKLSLVQKFLLIALFAVLTFGTVFSWLGADFLERSFLALSKNVIADHVRGSVEHHLKAADLAGWDSEQGYESIRKALDEVRLGTRIKRVKIWNREYTVIWSDEQGLVGQRFEDDHELPDAFAGKIVSELSHLDRPEHSAEKSFEYLLEIYIPIRLGDSGAVDHVFEIYHDLDPLFFQIRQLKVVLWVTVGFGMGLLFLALARFVTVASRRLQEQGRAIQFSEEKYGGLLQAAPDAIVSVNVKGHIVIANDAAAAMFGFDSEHMIGQPLARLMPEQSRQQHQDGMARFVASDLPRSTFKAVEMEGVRSDGTLFPLELTLSRSGRGQDTILTGIIRDISDRKQKEAEIKRYNAELYQKTAELERYIYTFSHDLKTPLVTLKLFLGMFEESLDKGDVEQVKTHIGFLHDASDRMCHLLDDLLEISRVGRLVGAPQRVSFHELAGEVLSAADASIGEKGIAVQICREDVALYGDRARLQEIWQNLVENAIKFMGQQSSPSIELGFRRIGNEPVFTVKDNGMGIDPSYHRKIFGLFDQLDPNAGGAGLGLTLIERIVGLYGGRIWVESEGLGKGACFCFTLPGALQSPEGNLSE